MNIADRIQYLRKQKGYSQEELADKVGVSRQAVSKWESEQSTPDLEKVIVMSELFEVTTDYILKGIEPVSTTNRKTVKALYLGSVLIFATIAGIWSFAANRFNYDEILMIILAGGVNGFLALSSLRISMSPYRFLRTRPAAGRWSLLRSISMARAMGRRAKW